MERRPPHLGLCFTEEQERLYAAGWPHLIQLVDGHKHDRKPADAARKLYKDWFGAYHVRWPRQVALRFARAIGVDPALESAEAARALEDDRDLAAEEVKAILDAQLATPAHRDPIHNEHTLFALEALAGTDVALEALAAALEQVARERRCEKPPGATDPSHHGAERRPYGESDDRFTYFAFLSGYLLLRASEEAAARAGVRLEALYREAVEANAEIHESLLRGALDLALHGTEGARRVLPTSHWQYLLSRSPVCRRFFHYLNRPIS